MKGKKEDVQLGRRIVVFIGPEGSGKTTIAQLLANQSGKPYITTGSILRDLAANDPGPLGNACRDMFATHTYLAGSTLLQIVAQRFAQDDARGGFILDGGFRSVEEIQGFPEVLRQAKRNLPVAVVYLQIPELVSYQRLVSGKDARKREDDTMEAVSTRLSKFYFQLQERLNLIKSHPDWALVNVDATPPVDDVYAKIYKLLA